MRPVKQAGVISTHSVLYFAPAAASTGSGAALLLLHVSREGFFFISACMLTYAYADMRRAGLRRFYWRRFLSVGIPYLCWSVIYFLYGLPTSHYASVTVAFMSLANIVASGYFQLYFLLVIMQFYLAFPLVLMLLRRTRGHHGLVIAVTVLVQIAIAIGMHWKLFPREMIKFGQQDVISYPLYLIGGCVVAFHLDQVHAWVRAHARLIVAMTVAAALAAEGVYFLAAHGVTTILGSGSDPFQPSVIAFNVGAVTCGYLAGVALVQPRRSRQAKAVVRSGSENAYGIYLSHMLVIIMLTRLGWAKLSSVIPWPMLCLVTVAIVFALGMALTSFLARTPLAVPLTGRTQMPWRLQRFLTAHPALLESATDHAEPVATSDIGYPSTVPRARSV